MTQNDNYICQIKFFRQKAGLSQAQLADHAGVKRQAIYDMETGRYLPNTGVALRLARHLGCRVEDLFQETPPYDIQPVTMAEDHSFCSRVSLAKVRGRLIGYPLEGMYSFCNELNAADGIIDNKESGVRLLGSGRNIDNTVFLLGCDPAFSILAAHVFRHDQKSRIICRFASSHRSLNALATGQAHLAGTHLRSTFDQDANVSLARERLSRIGGRVVGFSFIEEGLMVSPGNPMGIRSVQDLAAPGIRIVNREPGAALRVLLDDELAKNGIPATSVHGYEHEVKTHNEGAQMVACNAADAALGLRTVACAFNLDFVPVSEVRCDLVIPADLMEHPTIQIILDTMQTRDLRDEINFLPGYDTSETGKTIAVF